jgi:uncharacterized SAM-dependent methyltransferase
MRLLEVLGTLFPPESRFIVGVDLKKDVGTLLRAYDDADGVTARFNLNLLARINRELGSSVDLGTFRHEARYNATDGRIEMHLVSRHHQTIEVLGRRFQFRPGESIHTENSCKYAPAEFTELARSSGWQAACTYSDAGGLFAVFDLRRVVETGC